MTLLEAMHVECDWCGEDAGHHRLTDSGNFYCLEPGGQNAWMRSHIRSWSTRDARLWAMNKAKCSELRKSLSLSRQKEVAATILLHVRGITLPFPSPIGD